MADGNQVTRTVRFEVRLEEAVGNDVMDIELLADVLLCDTTHLTGVPITVTDAKGDDVPITSPILRATVEGNRFGTGLGDLGAPTITTVRVTEIEMEVPRFDIPLRALERFSTDKALHINFPSMYRGEVERELQRQVYPQPAAPFNSPTRSRTIFS